MPTRRPIRAQVALCKGRYCLPGTRAQKIGAHGASPQATWAARFEVSSGMPDDFNLSAIDTVIRSPVLAAQQTGRYGLSAPVEYCSQRRHAAVHEQQDASDVG